MESRSISVSPSKISVPPVDSIHLINPTTLIAYKGNLEIQVTFSKEEIITQVIRKNVEDYIQHIPKTELIKSDATFTYKGITTSEEITKDYYQNARKNNVETVKIVAFLYSIVFDILEGRITLEKTT